MEVSLALVGAREGRRQKAKGRGKGVGRRLGFCSFCLDVGLARTRIIVVISRLVFGKVCGVVVIVVFSSILSRPRVVKQNVLLYSSQGSAYTGAFP